MSNGDATFVFFDDFESGTLNKWDFIDYGQTVVLDNSNYVLKLYSETTHTPWKSVGKNIAPSDIRVDLRYKIIQDGDWDGARFGSSLRFSSLDQSYSYLLGDWHFRDTGTPNRYLLDSLSTVAKVNQQISYYSTPGVWYNWGFSVSGSSLVVLNGYGKDGEVLVSYTDTVKMHPNGQLRLWILDGGATDYVDDVRVRKFASLEPSVRVGAETPTLTDIEAKITNIWGSNYPILLFGQNTALGQVISSDLDSSPISEPLPIYTVCIGPRNSDKSVISRFKISDTKVRIVVNITGGKGFNPGSEGYIKMVNPEWKITEILAGSTLDMNKDYYGTGINIDKVNGLITWSGRGGSTAAACNENEVNMQFIVEKAPATITSITMSPSSATIVKDQNQLFTATDQDGNAIIVDWSSSDTTVGTVFPPTGTSTTFTASKAGAATVRATSGGVEGSAEVNVPDDIAPTTSIVLSGTTGNNGWYTGDITVTCQQPIMKEDPAWISLNTAQTGRLGIPIQELHLPSPQKVRSLFPTGLKTKQAMLKT